MTLSAHLPGSDPDVPSPLRQRDARSTRTKIGGQRRRTGIALIALSGIAVTSLVGALPASAASVDDGYAVVGGNFHGEFGNGTTTPSTSIIPVDFSGTAFAGETIVDAEFNDISAGVVVLTASGKVFTWGYNGFGETGDGTASSTPTSTPHLVDFTGTVLAGKTIIDVAIGNGVSALASDGTLASWGDNVNGVLGVGSTDNAVPRPLPIVTAGTPLAGEHIARVFSTEVNTYVQTDSGLIAAVGSQGLIPSDTGVIADTYRQIDVTGTSLEGKTLKDVTLAGRTNGPAMFALTTDGELSSWGASDRGNLGQGAAAPESIPTPTRIPAFIGVEIASVVGATDKGAAALTSTGDVYAWGDNTAGGVGDGTTVDAPTPFKVSLPAPATQLVYGDAHVVALLDTNALYGWGYNLNGQLGTPIIREQVTPILIPTAGTPLEGRTITAIHAGERSTMFELAPAAVEPVAIATPADGTTVTPRPTLTGTGEVGATVTFTDAGGATLGTAVVQADGSWTFPVPADLPAGAATITATQDADASVDSVDLIVQAAVVAPVTIATPTDGANVSPTPTITGAGEPGATVTLTTADGTVIGTAVVAADGSWTFPVTKPLPAGATTIIATQDVDGSVARVAVTVATAVIPGTGDGSSSGSDHGLASTGAEAMPLMLFGGLLLAVGVAAVALEVRRRRAIA